MAQTTVPASTPLYVVTYYETAPGAASAPALQNTITPAAAFTRYADSTAAEPGAVSLQVLDDSERPSRYVVLEVWQNASAFQQHRAAAATRQLGQDIAPWLNGPPDQRIHTRFE
jgi:quinol monooxygenase YgiN